jgi:hypothetical protein
MAITTFTVFDISTKVVRWGLSSAGRGRKASNKKGIALIYIRIVF